MTTMLNKSFFESAFSRPVFLILLVILLLVTPATAFASGEDDQAPDSTPTTEQTSSTDQSGGLDQPSSSGQSESPTSYEQENTGSAGGNDANSLETVPPDVDDSNSIDNTPTLEDTSSAPSTSDEKSAPAEVNASGETKTGSEGETADLGDDDTNLPEATSSDVDNNNNVEDTPVSEDPNSPSSESDEESAPTEVNMGCETETGSEGGTGSPGDTDPNDGQDLPSQVTEEAPVVDPDGTVVGEATSNATSYFQVQEVSMSPLLNPGSIVEVTSATYADGDMVVAQKSDGTYIVKMLSGDQLVPLGAGTSCPVADVTILGAAHLSSMTAESLEQSGLTWHTVLAQTATPPPSGDGSSGNPYLIATLENLYWIANDSTRWAAHYKQTANIDASATTGWFESGGSYQGWTPIGNSGTKFRGTYNGQGFTISGLFINRLAENYIGLFGYIGNIAVLQNIELVSVDITGNNYVGGLTGKNYKGDISNCSVTGNVTGEGSYVGGLVGENDEDGTISNSYATGNVTGDNTVGGLVGKNTDTDGKISNSNSSGTVKGKYIVGGLAGQNVGNIINCSASGTFIADGTLGGTVAGLVGQNTGTINKSSSSGTANGDASVGGLVGSNLSGTINNCYANVTVTGDSDYIGGLIGISSSGIIEKCYAAGDVAGGTDVGGLVGRNQGTSISNSYAAGKVTGTTNTGGLLGYNSSDQISNNFWCTDVNEIGLTGIGSGITLAVSGKTTAEMQTIDFHQNTLVWDIAGQDGSYPVLGWQVDWTDNIWYMGTPPTPDNANGGNFGGDFGFFDFGFPPGLALLAQNGSGLTTITGQGNAPITPGIIASGSWNDLNQAVAAYQAALASLENNRTTLSPSELALLEVELAIARAAILALETKLLAAEGLPFNLANLQAAYAAAVATITANQSALSAGQMAAANQLLAAIAGVITALQQMNV